MPPNSPYTKLPRLKTYIQPLCQPLHCPLTTMSSPSHISIPQNLLSLKPLLKSSKTSLNNKLLLPTPRRASRYFIPLLAFWALLNISQVLLSTPPAACSRHHLRPDAQKLDNFWKWAYSGAANVRPCLDFSESYRNSTLKEGSAKYIMMAVVSGGLNQQRNQIIDAVVVARILGAALVVPVLQVNQVWGDESEFGDIFDVRHFKETLKDDVAVISSLPSTHLRNRRVRAPRMPFHADENWVRQHYTHKLGRESVLLLRAFDSRLSKDLNADLQKLRCKVAFEALKFQPWIQGIAGKFIERMKEEGPYMALHLRLEKDVWVRTGCHSGLGKEADLEIASERASKPQFLTSRSKLTPQQRYHAGLCPLNANAIFRLLKGLGVSRKTKIYWAGGEPFGGQKALQPLQSQFPNLFNKWSLAGPGELDGIKRKPSVMAALDYAVCLESQFFMASHGGNMARSLRGHRTYMGQGKHIRPNKKLLAKLFMDKTLSDDEMERKVKQIHTVSLDVASVLRNNTNVDVIGFPIPYCMCSRETTGLTSVQK